MARQAAINMRVAQNKLDLIDVAVQFEGTTRTSFIISAALREAEILLSRCTLTNFDLFEKALEKKF